MATETMTTPVPAVVGTLALALLRHHRFVANEEMESWLDVLRRVLESHVDDPDADKFLVRHMDVEDGYDLWAKSYDDGGNPLISVEGRAIEELLQGTVSANVLDAACGTGRVTSVLANMGHTVVGVDKSEAMLSKARAKVPGGKFENAWLESLSFEDDLFDLVICSLAITHFEDILAPIAEFARVVKPGGRIIISDIHPFSLFLGGEAFFPSGNDEFGLIRNCPHSHGDYIKAFHDAGLRISACLEPTISDAEVSMLVDSRYRAEFGNALGEMAKKALVGFPAALIWDLEKPS